MFKKFLAASMAASLVFAQTPVGGSKPAGPRMILVDVQVNDGKNPIRDLKASDFVLEDSGKKQTIALFDVTESGKLRTPAAPLPAGVVSNRVNSKGEIQGTATVLLYDRINSNVGDQAFVRSQILGVLGDLKPTDRLGFYSIGLNGLQMVTDFDQDAATLAKAAKALAKGGQAPADFTPQEQAVFRALAEATSPTQEMQPQARVNLTYPIFQSVGWHLGGTLGRKNLMWIASWFPLTYGNQQERRQEDQRELEKFTRYMTENNIVVYPIDPSGSGGSFNQRAGAPVANEGSLLAGTMRNAAGTSAVNISDSSLTGTQSMLMIADATGGKTYRNANDIGPALREVLAASEYTYTLGFYPDASTLDGRNRDLKVTVPGNNKAKVTHRKKYWAWGPDAPADQKGIANLQDVLNSNLAASRVGLLGIAKPEGNDSGNTVVDVRIAAGDLTFIPGQDGQWAADFMVVMIPDGGGPTVAKDYAPSFSEADLKRVVAEGMDLREVIATGAKGGFMHIALVDKKSGLAGNIRVPYAVAGKAPAGFSLQ